MTYVFLVFSLFWHVRLIKVVTLELKNKIIDLYKARDNQISENLNILKGTV